MSANGMSTAIAWKPLIICPHADLSHKLCAVWKAMAQPQAMVESPRYLDRPALGDLIARHAVTICFVDVATDPERGLELVREIRDLGIPAVALHTGNDPDLILSC